jgi:hypothetical protein
MAVITVTISAESLAYLRQRNGHKERGVGRLLEGLIQADRAREEMRAVLRAQRQLVPTKDDWDATGNRTD